VDSANATVGPGEPKPSAELNPWLYEYSLVHTHKSASNELYKKKTPSFCPARPKNQQMGVEESVGSTAGVSRLVWVGPDICHPTVRATFES